MRYYFSNIKFSKCEYFTLVQKMSLVLGNTHVSIYGQIVMMCETFTRFRTICKYMHAHRYTKNTHAYKVLTIGKMLKTICKCK